MRAQLHAAIGATTDRRRALQGPALFVRLERRAQQAALPVGILQTALERSGEIQRRPVEPQRGLMTRARATGIELQVAHVVVAQLQRIGDQPQRRAFAFAERRIEAQALHLVSLVGQCLAVQTCRTLRRRRATGQLHEAVEPATEPGPELRQTRHLHTQFAGQRLAPAPGAMNTIGPDAQVEARDVPVGALPGRRKLQLARLAAQLAGEVQLGLGLQRFVAQRASALERTAELAGQLRQPVRRVQLAQLQVGLPGDAIGEADAQAASGCALACAQLQLRQVHHLQVAAERAVQAEIAGRTT